MRGSLKLALLGLLVLVSPALSADKPAALIRLAPLDDLISDLRYLVKQVGREEEAKQVEALLKARTGPKGLEGIDVKKAIGLYANVKPSLTESEIVLLLPIADEKTFLDFLDGLNLKPEKDKDGLYTLQVENIPVPFLFRFANGYLYGMAKLNEKATLPDRDNLPRPEKFLASGSGILSVTTNVDAIPVKIRKTLVTSAVLVLGELKTRELPTATDKQKDVWTALLDDAARQAKSLLEDTGAIQLKIDLDRKTNDVNVSFRMEGKPDTTLAHNLAALSPKESMAAALAGKESVLGSLIHLALPPSVKKALAPAIDEAIDKAMETLDAGAKDLLTPLVDALRPTAKAGLLDLGLDVRGPGKKGKYTVVAAMTIQKGDGVEKAIKDIVDKLPEEARGPIKLDAVTVGEVNVHRIDQKKVDPQTSALFGTGPLYVAFRKDAAILAMGENALDAIRTAAATKPTAGQPLRVEVSVARLAPLMVKQHPTAPEAAKKAFAEAGSDRVRLEVQTTRGLEVKLSVQTGVLRFGGLLEEAKKAP